MKTWKQVAEYCENVYGSYVDWEEGFFICPECEEPIYEIDWLDNSNWNLCPICEFYFEA